ncbi:MAG: carboxypeptidase-like regulatory domain-containing protein [Bryobacteraceae bacterium]
MRWILAAAASALCAQQPEPVARIAGRVIDARTGEALGKASVRCFDSDRAATTDPTGRFELPGEGPCDLRVAAVGYRPFRQSVQLGAQLEVALHPDTLRQSDTVQVAAGPFAVEANQSLSLAGNELRNLASVIADDPMRAVQSLPGVTSQDDFRSQFAIRGAGFERVGLYVDGILLHAPFHTVQGDPNSASLTLIQGEILESANLHEGPPPVEFGDRSAGALDFRMRDGSRQRTSGRINASASNAGGSAEGPIGKRGSWLVAARKSYLDYIIQNTSSDPSIAFGFWDTQGRASYDLGRGHTVGLTLMEGHSGLGREGDLSRFGLNTFTKSDYHFTLAYASWKYANASGLILSSRAGFLRERYLNKNKNATGLQGGHYQEWLWNSDAEWQWRKNWIFQAGAVARRLRDGGYLDRVQTSNPTVRLDYYEGSGARGGAYVQQAWLPAARWRIAVGWRFDHHGLSRQTTMSPWTSLSVGAWRGAAATLTWSQASQFPELVQLLGRGGRTSLRAPRSAQTQFTLEQRLNEKTRVRLELYDRRDRGLLWRPLEDARFIGPRLYVPPLLPPWENSLYGWARGFQAMVQRRAANGVTGWISYGYNRSSLRDRVTGAEFPMDFDLRHSIRVFGSWRFRPTVNLSGKFTYGTGLPIRGFFEQRGADVYLSERRNRLLLPAYQRTDVRLNKAFFWKRRQLTLFAEAINLTNHDNYRFDALNGFDSRGRARIGLDKMFPVLPSAGLVIDF